MLGPWNRDFWHKLRAGHPAGRRCSSLPYAQYAHSSRLARRAPRSGPYASYHGSRGLAAAVDPHEGLLYVADPPAVLWVIELDVHPVRRLIEDPQAGPGCDLAQ